MMRRQFVVLMTLSLLLGILLPVNAEETAGPDTSGFDIDIGRTATELLDNNGMVLMSPPRYQWTADRYLEEGRRCADRCKDLRDKYITLPEGDPVVRAAFDQGLAFCECAQKNYNKALQMTKDDDYSRQAEIFGAGTRLYESMGMTKEAEQTRQAEAVARTHAAASDLFLPLSPFAALAGILVGLFLLRGRG
jgi:hypothetical protein